MASCQPTNKPYTESKSRFWSKFRSTPSRKRHTSDSVLPTLTPSPLSHPSPLTPPPCNTSATPSLTTPTNQQELGGINLYTVSSKEMLLSEFAQQYQNNLPQQVVVTHGVYWDENLEVNISSSERLNVHFIRHRESVKIRELGSKVEYSVPVTSTLEYGLVYNPYKGNIRDALRGFIYPMIADILRITERKAPLPKFITASIDSTVNTPGDQVKKGELLLIKGVCSDTRLGHRQLKVFSLTTNAEKYLHECCTGNFTTKPETNKLSLFSIIKHLPNAFPLSVMIFSGPDLDLGDQHYPTHLFHNVIQLTRTFTDVLVVASSVLQDSTCDSREPFEIPQEVELELLVVKLRDSDYEQLKEKSQQIMCQIQGDYLKQYRNAHQNQADYIVQEMFLRAVDASEEEDSTPAVPAPRERKCSDTRENSEEREDTYPNVQQIQEGLLSRLGRSEETVWKMKKARAHSTSTSNMEDMAATQNGTETATHKLQQQLEEQKRSVKSDVADLQTLLESQQQHFQEELGKMQAALMAVQTEVEEGRREMEGLRKNPTHEPEQVTPLYQQELLASAETAKRNRDLVATLTATQVLHLVVELGIEDLQQITQEKISGDILVELNESELESELGIMKRIHRLKLMKIISGSKPVTDYLNIQEASTSMDALC